MADANERQAAVGERPSDEQARAERRPSDEETQAVGSRPSDEETRVLGNSSDEDRSEIGQRAAYEAELNRITSSEMILQTAVSLINIAGRRLGLAPSASPGGGERDLEQVRDAIDGASALLPILERRMPRELGPLRDAIAQLQVAYAREAQAVAGQTSSPAAPHVSRAAKEGPAGGQQTPAKGPGEANEQGESAQPGPAESSGRLWVPGR